MAFEAPSLVRITNLGDKPFVDAYANVKYTILPGKAILAPWDAALLWLGNPTLRDKPDQALFDRTDEVQRILVRLGAHVHSDSPETQGTDEERIERFRPKLKVEDVDGEQIAMLSEDPTGESTLPTNLTRGDTDDLRAELDDLKQKQARLLELLENQRNENTAPGLDSVPDDVPTKVVAPSL